MISQDLYTSTRIRLLYTVTLLFISFFLLLSPSCSRQECFHLEMLVDFPNRDKNETYGGSTPDLANFLVAGKIFLSLQRALCISLQRFLSRTYLFDTLGASAAASPDFSGDRRLGSPLPPQGMLDQLFPESLSSARGLQCYFRTRFNLSGCFNLCAADLATSFLPLPQVVYICVMSSPKLQPSNSPVACAAPRFLLPLLFFSL